MWYLLFVVLSCMPVVAGRALGVEPLIEKRVVFAHDGVDWYRIPSIVVSPTGAVLAFCDRRKESVADWGHDTDIVLRRSLDGGKTWLPMQTLAQEGGVNHHGGPALIDRQSGRILKFYKRRPAALQDRNRYLRELAQHPQRWKDWGVGSCVVWSEDDGVTWSPPQRIDLEYPGALGPVDVGNGVHGVQLPSGRLAIQAYVSLDGSSGNEGVGPQRSFLLQSDDAGTTWKLGIGWPVESAAMEFALALLPDGRIYVNQRTLGQHRNVAWIAADGKTITPLQADEALAESVCHAAALATRDCLLFANPAVANTHRRFSAEARRRLTVRVSRDGGQTWPAARVIEEGPAAYCDLAALPGGTVLCIYESGEKDPHESIHVASFNLAWIERKE